MVRIWAKVMKGSKIIKQFMFEKQTSIDYSEFFDYLREICENLEIATPVLIKTHLLNFAKYNNVRFTQNDFVETISFDKLVLENAFI